MYREKVEDLGGLLDRACREAGATVGILSDGQGRDVVARVGDDTGLPTPARQFLSPASLRRVALALDDEDPEHVPTPEQTGGARVFCAKADRYVLTIAGPADLPFPAFQEAVRTGVRRIEAHLEGLRRDRRRRFLGHRLLTRVSDREHFMPADVHTTLARLCDGLLDMEECLAAFGDPSPLVRSFMETLDELVAWPKGGRESFQHNLEILQDSVKDLRPEDLSPERLEAMIAGLEVTIESWLLP